MEIAYSSRFIRSLGKLPIEIQQEFEERMNLFRLDPFDPKLSTHKLGGRLSGFWSFSVTHSHRVLFTFVSGTAEFVDIGDHRVYR